MPLAQLPTQLTVEVHNRRQRDDNDGDSDDDGSDTANDNEQPPAPTAFIWAKRESTEDVDKTYKGPPFSPAPEPIPDPIWYFHKFMDQPIFDEISNQTNIYGHAKSGLALNISAREIE